MNPSYFKIGPLIFFCFLMFPVVKPQKKPDVVTEKTRHDTDDPAIWINKNDPSKSIIFGTDKNSDGAIYAFDLKGKILEEKTIRNLKRPNNVDVRYGFKLDDSTQIDILAFTERERNQVRFFSVPDMKPLDNGGFPVFQEESKEAYKSPMGISLYSSPVDGSLYAIVGRKDGPDDNYLHQYKVEGSGKKVDLKLVRRFGKFSGKKEIEAIAVDDELGFIYYSDEAHCIRKYYAEPSKGNEELSCFGSEFFQQDIEGIAIAAYEGGAGYIVVSNQQEGTFNLFSRQENTFMKEVDLGTKETDGCDVVTVPLNKTFKNGLFVAMNNDRDFYLYDLNKLKVPVNTP